MANQRLGLLKDRYLSENEIFRDLCEKEKRWLGEVTTMITCEKGRIFYMPGETGQVLFILKRGHVQLYRLSSEGRKLVIGTLGPGTIFGEMSLVGQGMYDAYAEALEDCPLCAMGQADLERLITVKPEVGLRLLRVLGRRLVQAESKLEEIAFRSVPARLAAVLLRLADEQGGDEIVGMTQQELAEMAGAYRETATQVLNRFKAGGLVGLRRRRVNVVNREPLRDVARS